MRSKEFAFCNKVLYTHHPYLSEHQNVQLSTVSYIYINTHTPTVSKKLLCREHASQCLLGKSKVHRNCKGITNIILTCTRTHTH